MGNREQRIYIFSILPNGCVTSQKHFICIWYCLGGLAFVFSHDVFNFLNVPMNLYR